MLRDILGEIALVPRWALAFMANCVLMLWYLYSREPEFQLSSRVASAVFAVVLAVITGIIGFVFVIGFLVGEFLESLAWHTLAPAEPDAQPMADAPATEDPWPRR